ncbi:energy transducer TonB [Bacteroidota bacterium]
MSKNRKYSNIDPEDLLRYTSDGMSEEERHAIERKLQKDVFEEEALEGLSSLGAEQARVDLSRLRTRLHRRVTGTSSRIWVRVAASVAILLTIGTLYFTVFTDKFGMMNRKVAETESSEQSRDKGVPGEMQKELPEADADMKVPDHATAEAKPSPAAIQEEKQEENREEGLKEYEPAPDQTEELVLAGVDEVTLTEEDAGAEDPIATQSIIAEAETEPEGAGAGAGESEVTLQGEEVAVETQDVIPTVSKQYTMASPTAMEESQMEDLAGIEPVEANRAERSAGKSAVSSVSKKLSGTTSARPDGGEELFNEYIAENIRFPETDTTITKGDVVMSFSIGPQGRPLNIEVEESPGEAFSIEAIRLLQEGPDWLPAIENGIPVEEKTQISIEFVKD